MSAAPARDRSGPAGDLILVLNCGSSSIKFALFDARGEQVPRVPLWHGRVEGLHQVEGIYRDSDGVTAPLVLPREQPYREALGCIQARVDGHLKGRALAAVSHRVVHGGERYRTAVRLDRAMLAELRELIPLAPLHQPFALDAIAALLESAPQLPQIACFDTAFHHTLPKVERLLPLPYAAWDRGLRRYGFHGLSYDYMARVLPERYGERARGRVIVAHLGSGASLCALYGMRSIATSMGFSALDGLMMGTRCGALDPGVLLYLIEHDGLSADQLGHMLYHESGLAGVSGLSSELPVLLANEAREDAVGARVRDALALYVRRIVREAGALAAVLGGLDLLVFTAGVGEHCAAIRSRICQDLGFLGIELDEAANDAAVACSALISAPSSKVAVAVEPTNEEWIAALQAAGLLAGNAAHINPSEGD